MIKIKKTRDKAWGETLVYQMSKLCVRVLLEQQIRSMTSRQFKLGLSDDGSGEQKSQEVTKRCRLSWLTNRRPSYMSPNEDGGGGGLSQYEYTGA
jgi:hypothetical protein